MLIQALSYVDILKIISKDIINTNLISNYSPQILGTLKNEDRVNLIFTCSKNLEKLNMNSLLKDSITLLDGKGGGSAILAQGGGRNNGNLESALSYTFNKIEKML